MVVSGGANSYITLAQAISEYKTQFSRKQRFHVALVLASSFVQLKNTPWIAETLRKTDIEFPHNAASQETTLQHDHLFVARGFESLASRPQLTGVDTKAINALGVVLLELCFGEPIERVPWRVRVEGETSDRVATNDLMAAMVWLRNVNSEAGLDYFDAVEWCLLGCTRLDLKAPWRQEMLRHVVEPLQRSYSYLFERHRSI
ncbi:hypothetical protein B0H67DRAFT_521497 [Lasiosphaeris hirsuta]|uniref:DUF7580 domain-containing protein n=1 Tax=Lasiosphaeris hirsuta TaxID=260670 RepID=A0AA39ZVC6_9PEZI|nr:hypothetical protein B0H67DRAFT_521497 [Lasiosphaeris hirsuta]